MDVKSDTQIADSGRDADTGIEPAGSGGTGGFGWLRHIMWTVGIVAGVITTCLGLVVVLGWHTGNRTLIQVMPQFVPMQYNTALGFIFAGSALTMLAAGRRKLSIGFGAVTAVIGGLTLVEYIGGVSLGIDELFMVHDITTKTSHPGRMAPNTAACFTLIGLAAVIRKQGWSPIRQSVVTVVLASLTFGLAVVALSGYVAQLETAYGWGNLTRMAVHTSAGFTVASLGMLAWIWSGDKAKRSWLPEWMPIPTFVAVLTATLCLWQAVSAEGQRIHRQHEDVTSLSGLSTLILVVGTLLAVALALVAFLAQQASIRSTELKEHRDSLEDTVAERTKELRRINFLSDIALELSVCGYWHVDYSDPDYYYQSERAAKILGEPPKPDGRYHLQNEWFNRLEEANPEAAEKTAERYQGAVDGRYGHYESTYAYKRPIDGQVVWVHALGQIVRDDAGKIQYMYGVYQDITESVQAAEALREAKLKAENADRTKSAFLANMSHELRTPMNAIIGYSEMLMEEAEDLEPEELIPDLQKIHGAGKHLLALINDILDLSKIEAGKMDLYMETFGLDGMIDEVGATVDTLIKQNGNKLVIERGANLGEMRADLTKVRQSLLNLLSNAAKFTDKGTITIGAQRERDEHGEGWVILSVADTGIGIPEDKVGKLFDEFSQADASTTRKYGGTGLGLAISRRFCQMMGGDIKLKSVEGEGSCFTIRLPASPRPSLADGPDSGPEQGGQTQGTDQIDSTTARGTVLVVDDDASNRDLLNRHLSKDGFAVIQAVDGIEALELARKHRPDVITLDVLMPSMDGWTVLKKLKDDPDTNDIPVIIVSMVDDKNLGYTLGATEYLTKPIDRKRLSQLLDRFRPLPTEGDVLVVEDDPGTREMIRRLLEGEGLTVREAANGREGLELINQAMPALVILDLMMPVMDGFEFVVHMRKDKSYDQVPVVVVTAKDLTQAEREALHGGVTKVLQKGAYSRDELLQLVSQSVARTSNTQNPTEGHDA